MSIYVCTDALPFFVSDILPQLRHEFVLVTGDSDAKVPLGIIDLWNNPRPLEEKSCYEILQHPKLLKWWAQNCVFTQDSEEQPPYRIVFKLSQPFWNKIAQLPIGLDYHTIFNDPTKCWRQEQEGSTPRYQEHILKQIRKTMKPWPDRIRKIHVRIQFFAERQQAFEQIPKELIEQPDGNCIPRTLLWEEMSQYVFVFSPYGGGPDCHRHWEALCLGCIPIIRSFGSNEMFQDLPVLIVKEWSDITQELLDETLTRFSSTTFRYANLSLKYFNHPY